MEDIFVDIRQISVDISQNTHSDTITFKEVIKYSPCPHSPIEPSLKIKIHINSYDFQSYAKIFLWTGLWELVHSISYSNMKSKKSCNENSFAEDRNELLRVAKEILSV
jgi:hypothetical protein